MRATRTELSALLRRIAGELPNLPEGSIELRAAHPNLQNIRRALARLARPAEISHRQEKYDIMQI